VLKIDRHISELLYEHDCVIVPELGGFIASYLPSAIHPVQHTFTAPAKKIAFNELLKQNDGLLASYMAQVESSTYSKALKDIEGYVDHCRLELSAGKKFVIEQVGTLSKNVEGNLQFEPFKNTNYLKDSFGLVTIQFLPMEQLRKSEAETVRELLSIRPSQRQPAPRTKPQIKFSGKKIVNTILITGSLAWLCFNLYIVSPSKFSLSTLSPVSETAKVVKPLIVAEEKAKAPDKAAEAPPVVVIEEKETPQPEASPVVAEKIPEPEKTSVVPEIIKEHNYYVIGGAFRSAQNASNFSETLKSEGFNNARVLTPASKLKLVCFAGFETFEEAQTELNRVKSMQKDAWIYRN
jgi:cell division septation protein DedD